jgi:L-histidine Nalpha-methyltransferase / hercynylcysteine S-oxide synthase
MSFSDMAEDRIIDIRQEKSDFSVDHIIRQDLVVTLQANNKEQKFMPELLLWDETGHKLFEDVINREEYYVQVSEVELLERYAEEIAQQLEPGAMIVELGSGYAAFFPLSLTSLLLTFLLPLYLHAPYHPCSNLSKTKILLRALDAGEKPISFYALDLSLSNLRRSLTDVPPTLYKHVKCHGLYGTFEDGLSWLQQSANALPQKCLLSLGATVGNFDRDEAAEFLNGFGKCLRPGGKDFMLISLDACKDESRIVNAYNDPDGINRRFNSHGLQHANEVLGEAVFKDGAWSVDGAWNADAGRHEWCYTATEEFRYANIRVGVGEKLPIIYSYMYEDDERRELWEKAGLVEKHKLEATIAPYSEFWISLPPPRSPVSTLCGSCWLLSYNLRLRSPRPRPPDPKWQDLVVLQDRSRGAGFLGKPALQAAVLSNCGKWHGKDKF